MYIIVVSHASNIPIQAALEFQTHCTQVPEESSQLKR